MFHPKYVKGATIVMEWVEIYVEDVLVKPVKNRVIKVCMARLRIVYHKDGAQSIRMWESHVENVQNPVVRMGGVEIIILGIGDIESVEINVNT